MTPTLSLDPIDYPDGDPYRDPAVHRARERFWWHQAIADELRRLRDECANPTTGSGYPAFNVPGLAGNIPGAHLLDTVRHCRQMITWGELVKAEPLWDSEPDLWVALREPPAA
ncbi:hypothetical protein [Rhodococcus sp. AH-ZY2]|uniref:hypothetical protein n=1 Tax=Rhodococcus sp. AH-ZY2 TaxID=3047468 RepID=UPI0027DFF8BC|nr:hypothetical protein [Rhodococcus sp. AH-ZY2]WML66352.1 hypothetical protein QNA09_27435 [Rhodococcus sp. AH-ZY2]